MGKGCIQNSVEKYEPSRDKVNKKYTGLNKKDHKFSLKDIKIIIEPVEEHSLFLSGRICCHNNVKSPKIYLHS